MDSHKGWINSQGPGQGDVSSSTRRLEVPHWADIRGNYPNNVAMALDRIMKMVRPARSGRLILWHGEPGTGKTNAIRALARTWRNWCQSIYITDPERLLFETSYLTEVLLREPRVADDGETTWRLLILEDTDEYLRADARRRAGSSLGRLLNLSDGILGQGMDILILITTNEDLARLHPAVTRPGRCLSTLEFGRFSPTEASSWLRAPVGQDLTLAELYSRRGDIDGTGAVVHDEETDGAYL